MMKLIKYYRNEAFTFWFYSFMPFMVGVETYIYLIETTSKDPSTIILLSSIIRFCEVVGLGFVIFQIFSHIQFIMSLKVMTPDMKSGIRDEVAKGVKRGRFVLILCRGICCCGGTLSRTW